MEPAAREVFLERGRRAVSALRGQLPLSAGVVAIELDSGEYFVAATLGKANEAARARYPDHWLYFVRLDDPGAELALLTW